VSIDYDYAVLLDDLKTLGVTHSDVVQAALISLLGSSLPLACQEPAEVNWPKLEKVVDAMSRLNTINRPMDPYAHLLE
jgi:hypothetical protein